MFKLGVKEIFLSGNKTRRRIFNVIVGYLNMPTISMTISILFTLYGNVYKQKLSRENQSYKIN